LSLFERGAQRASGHHRFSSLIVAIVATVFAVGGLVAAPRSVEAAGAKVVIVVGPVGSLTPSWIDRGKRLAAQARSYGASVTEIYSPNATWGRVKSAAQGAKVFIYLGHGNGYPSPYGAFNGWSKDGLGLNAVAGQGHYNVKYWGESYIARDIRFATNAVVILNHLCYASGNSEPGMANPTKSVAIQRADNYANGFFRARAKAVFAEGLGNASYVLYGLFRTSRTVQQIFWSAGTATRTYSFSFSSTRYPGARALMDPYAPGKYYRSVVGALGLTAGQWRSG